MDHHPSLTPVSRDGVELLVDEEAPEIGIAVAFSGRAGGVSPAPFDSLNLSTRSGDDPANVAENKRRLVAAAGFRSDSLTFVRQVHGTSVVDAGTCDDDTEGDALVGEEPGRTLAILTADCVPVLIAGEQGVAAIHAGWRGLAAGVIPAAIEKLGGADVAWVGPSIRACCYEVGPDVTSAFAEQGLPIADSWHVDTNLAATTQLRHAGIDRIAASSACTSCDRRYFSHRRDQNTGRQGGFIALL